jgi:CubicO group peptidase (beta-lactamase class C family)
MELDQMGEALAPHVRPDGVGGLTWWVLVGDEERSGALGTLDPGVDEPEPRPAAVDSIYRIASMSKPVTAVATLALVAQGRLRLDAPVDPLVPELADRRVLLDPLGPVDGPTEPARRPILVRDLLDNRLGLGMSFDFSQPQPVLDAMYELGVGVGATAPELDADGYLHRLGTLPLIHQPGEAWRYHTATDVLGVLLERATGAPLDGVLREHVLDPLGMADTTFWVAPDQQHRVSTCRWAEDGQHHVWDRPADGRWSQPPTFRSGATGLVSTVADYGRFARCLLADGAVPGQPTPLLPASLLRDLRTDQLTAVQRAEAHIDETGTTGWGLGVGVTADAHPSAPHRPVGSYGWDGGLGSMWWNDPTTGVAAVLLTTDGFSDASLPPVCQAFGAAVAGVSRGR